LEDLWDRVNIRLLADFLEENSALEELVIKGVNDFIFDVKEFVSALEKSPCLSKLSVEQLEIRGGDAKGIPKLDPTLQTKLNKIVETNKKNDNTSYRIRANKKQCLDLYHSHMASC